jgi:hypothetical protein
MAALVIAAGVAAHDAAAQNPPLRTISKLDLEYAEPFSCISGFRELSSGRVIVSDAREKTLQLIDLRTGAVTKIGREGQGPGEWSTPITLMALPGDTTLLNDPQNNRFLIINPDGTTGGEVKVNLAGAGGGIMVTRPRGIDRMGRLYFEGSGFTFTPGGGPPVTADSVPILRFDRRTSKADTLGFIHVPKPDVQVSNGGDRRMVMMMLPNVFNPQITWTAMPDGRVAIVYPEPYHVEWLSPSRARTAGPATIYQKIRVSDADKAGNPFPDCNTITITRTVDGRLGGGGGRATGSVRMGAPPGAGAGQEFPEFKPPFVNRAGHVIAAPNGELWVQRTRSSDDDVTTYDVFNAAGRLSGRVALPKKTSFVAFGNGTIYLSRMDDDDLVYLQRYRLDAAR